LDIHDLFLLLSDIEKLQKNSVIVSAAAATVSAMMAGFSAWIGYSMKKMSEKQQEMNRKIIKIEHEKMLMNMINETNKTLLSSDENIKAIIDRWSKLYKINENENENENEKFLKFRKIWIIFMELNYLEATFLSLDRKMIDEDFANPILERLLDYYILDQESYDLILLAGYSRKFQDHCKNRRKELLGAIKEIDSKSYENSLT
jgi:hypothetical protein